MLARLIDEAGPDRFSFAHAIVRGALYDRLSASRRVRIQCDLRAEEMECVIADEGDGFDHSVYSRSTDPAQLFEELGTSLHGRGIMLTCLQFDKVEFNDKGNVVTIVKRARKLAKTPA